MKIFDFYIHFTPLKKGQVFPESNYSYSKAGVFVDPVSTDE